MHTCGSLLRTSPGSVAQALVDSELAFEVVAEQVGDLGERGSGVERTQHVARLDQRVRRLVPAVELEQASGRADQRQAQLQLGTRASATG